MAVGAVRMKTNVLLSFDRNPFTNCTRNDSYLYDAHHPHPRLLAHTLWFLHVLFFFYTHHHGIFVADVLKKCRGSERR